MIDEAPDVNAIRKACHITSLFCAVPPNSLILTTLRQNAELFHFCDDRALESQIQQATRSDGRILMHPLLLDAICDYIHKSNTATAKCTRRPGYTPAIED
jgi:hypothetical protein